ncbi:MAG: tripartite tricarboxylate transporter substrate binding protein, partial [Betaproteobacteria bacterium]|nr:tripartite tricarboxylate transporter substrate binding protein [Betaproteobacteria bacterium]
MLRRLLPLLLAGCALIASSAAFAQDFPNRPIRLYVGFTPGTGIDVIARIVAAELSKTMPQPVIIDNKAGAGGNIAGEATAKAAPDG